MHLSASGDRGGIVQAAALPHTGILLPVPTPGSPAWTLFLLRALALPFHTSGALVPDHAGSSSWSAPLSRRKGTFGRVLTVPACTQVCWNKTGGRALGQVAERPGNKSPALSCLVRRSSPLLDCSPVSTVTNNHHPSWLKTACTCYLTIRTPIGS